MSYLVRVNGKYNASKAATLLTLAYFTLNLEWPGLTIHELTARSRVGYDYLRCRLPAFAGANGWKHQYVRRRAVVRDGKPVFLYRLSAYGKEWVLVKLDENVRQTLIKYLFPTWSANNSRGC